MTRDVHFKGAAHPDRRAAQDRLRASPETPAILILRQGLSQQDSLTRGQRRSRGPRDTMGGGVLRRCPLTVMMVASVHHLITPASVTGRHRAGLGKTPLTSRAIR